MTLVVQNLKQAEHRDASPMDMIHYLADGNDALSDLPVPRSAETQGRFPLIPGYELLCELGRGGMGIVYKARQLSLERIVAIKVIRADKLESVESLRRFLRETRAASALSHPHFVKVFDAGQTGDLYFLIMEYVEGVDLERLVHRTGPLDVETACNYVHQAALGLQHAFENGLVHRDIKPGNLIVSKGGIDLLLSKEVLGDDGGVEKAAGAVKILDMGLARLRKPGDSSSSILTQEGTIMGTPDYIAPEQVVNSHTVDIRADLYSLGCTFYFLLTRQVPFPARSSLEKLDKQRWGNPRVLERYRRDVPPDVLAIVRKLMEKRPEDRFQTPAELVAALEAVNFEQPAVEAADAGVDTLPLAVSKTERLGPPQHEEEFAKMQLALADAIERGALEEAVQLVHAMKLVKPADSVVAAAQAFLEQPNPSHCPGECHRFEGHTNWAWGVAFSSDGTKAISASEDKKIIVWDMRSRQKVRTMVGHTDAVKSVAFSPDGRLAVSGGKDKTMRLWDVDSGREMRCFSRHSDAVLSVAFAPVGRRLLSAGSDRYIRLWDVDTGSRIRKLTGHTADVKSIVFSADARYALSGSWDHTARVWDLATGLEINRLKSSMNWITGVAFSPDGRRALFGGSDNIVYLWDVESEKEIARFEGHTNWITSVAFSPDGKRVLSGSQDKTVRLWDTATGRLIHCFEGHTNWVTSVAFCPKGQFALSGSTDRTLRLWRLPESTT